MKIKMRTAIFRCIVFFILCFHQVEVFSQSKQDEQFRPLYHFTPAEHWMNDPNGMIYYAGTYHLFYQYHPYSSVWGPMHWGHATSKDLIKWEHMPIALYPDKNGMIFSGSAVLDENNTSGLGKNGIAPLVAIFTYHNDSLAKMGSQIFQTQGIAYSNDSGKTWSKFEGNPVLKNPGINDFRDPKVFWHEASKQWIMTLAVFDRIHFYGSSNLKEWTKLSEFGVGYGVPNILWECPDLFPLKYKDKTIWVLISNINPGGPNKGSSTQYFIGDFDGKQFHSFDHVIRWADFGPDEYAGVSWSNTGDRKIFTGWMSNWLYAQQVPTTTWRSALTIARELTLKEVNAKYYLASKPVHELDKYKGEQLPVKNRLIKFSGKAILNLPELEKKDFHLKIGNDRGEYIILGFEKDSNRYFIDRTHSGITEFHKDFAMKSYASRIANSDKLSIEILLDKSSVELFADDGLTVMTSIYFPNSTFNKIEFVTDLSEEISKVKCYDISL